MDTPVLLLVYNRPEKTKRVLERLKELGVSRVYVSGDGSKNDRDLVFVNEVKSSIDEFESIISARNFSNQHLGCKTGVLSGIDWFFNQVEEGIILEDDCLPNEAFFNFSQKLLEGYRNDKAVTMISGNNPLGNWHSGPGYFFSRIGHVWGWATWKTKWQALDPELPDYDAFVANKGFEKAFGPTHLAQSRKQLTAKALSGEIDTWDYQWNAHMLMCGGLAAIPSKNLIENVGFDELGTHTKAKPKWISFEVNELTIPEHIIPPLPNREFEMEVFLAQKADKPANVNSGSFQQSGENKSGTLRVAIINSTDIGGGAEKIALNLHQQLVAKGHDSTLFVSTKKSDSATVIELEENWTDQLSALKPDIIHVHNLHGTQISLKQLEELSSPFKTLFTLHDSWLTTGSSNHPFILESNEVSLLERKDLNSELANRKLCVSKSVIRFTAPSQWLRERFFKTHGIRPYYVPNAVSQVEKENCEIPSNRYILFVANKPEKNPYKDFKTLKTAWQNANETLGTSGCDLICIGYESSESVNVGDFRLHKLKRMNSESINSFLEGCMFVIQASKQDNSPLTIIEAHVSQKKVLASLVGGIPELLNPEEINWMYQHGDSADLTEQLVKAITEVENVKDEKITFVHSSIEDVTDMYLGHYRDLLNG
jgi:glycosyltransferase involved in cell wall biosynthesis